MIAKGYFTKRELALIIGLDLMDIPLTEIAEDLGRSELDVATALTRAQCARSSETGENKWMSRCQKQLMRTAS
jgi:hypothetical protein